MIFCVFFVLVLMLFTQKGQLPVKNLKAIISGFDLQHQERSLLQDLSTQCNRTYSDALQFSSTISKGTCPSLPHEAIAGGWRNVKNYQGVWHVDNCELKWFLPHEACDLIGSIGKIAFKGDSLIRQLMVAFGVILSGNYRSGGLSRGAPPKYLEACQCERQWLCWKVWGYRFDMNSPQFDLCPRWTRDHILTPSNPVNLNSTLEDYNPTHGPVIVIANGAAMHSVSNFEVPKRIMENLLKQAKKTNGTLIPMTLHYPGMNKIPVYRSSQGPPQIEAMNKKIVQWAKREDLWPLRLFEYTKGLWTIDGVHFGDENIVFAQLLLNSLWRMQREHRLLAVVPERNPRDPTSYKFGHPKDVGIPIRVGEVPRPYQSIQ